MSRKPRIIRDRDRAVRNKAASDRARECARADFQKSRESFLAQQGEEARLYVKEARPIFGTPFVELEYGSKLYPSHKIMNIAEVLSDQKSRTRRV